MVWMLQGLKAAVLVGGATNAVFLEGVKQHRVLSRMTGLFWDNAPAKTDGGNQDACYY